MSFLSSSEHNERLLSRLKRETHPLIKSTIFEDSKSTKPIHKTTVDFDDDDDNDDKMTIANRLCLHPEYIVFTWILCLISLATALKLYYLVKTFLAVVLLTVYIVLIFVKFKYVFDETSASTPSRFVNCLTN